MRANGIFAIPGDLGALTGGYGYDRRILAEAAELGATLEYLRVPGNFPVPSQTEIDQALLALSRARPDGVLLVDGLAYGALPPAALATIGRPLVALVHHPLGLETGLEASESMRLIQNERNALAHARATIVTSDTTRDTLVADFGIPADKITIAEPGVDPAARARGSSGGDVELLAVGSIVPRKGFNVLIEALAPLRNLEWRLTIVGSAQRAPETAATLRARIERLGLRDRVDLVGEMGPDQLNVHYDRSDLFVLSSLYEGYGMVLSEAMARGLPIVSTTGGAAARTVPDGAALKVPPGDAGALRHALATAISDKSLRTRLADESWRAGQALPRWRETAMTVLDVLERVRSRA